MSWKGAEIRGVDFHCHLDLYPDPVSTIVDCERERILTLAVTTTPRAWAQNKQWTQASEYVYASPGLHPELAGELNREIEMMESCVRDSQFVGEVGLDGSPKYRKTWDDQVSIFVEVITLANQFGGRVLSIHSRRAVDQVLSLLAEHSAVSRVLPVLHWFSGSKKAARSAVDWGCYFSINGQSLNNRAGLDLVRYLPEDRILTETDGPFTSRRGLPAKPKDVVATVQHLAAARHIAKESMHQSITRNAIQVLRFAGIGMDVDL